MSAGIDGDQGDLKAQARDTTHVAPAPDAVACGRLGCYASDDLLRVDPKGGKTRVLCSRHTRDYLGVSS